MRPKPPRSWRRADFDGAPEQLIGEEDPEAVQAQLLDGDSEALDEDALNEEPPEQGFYGADVNLVRMYLQQVGTSAAESAKGGGDRTAPRCGARELIGAVDDPRRHRHARRSGDARAKRDRPARPNWCCCPTAASFSRAASSRCCARSTARPGSAPAFIASARKAGRTAKRARAARAEELVAGAFSAISRSGRRSSTRSSAELNRLDCPRRTPRAGARFRSAPGCCPAFASGSHRSAPPKRGIREIKRALIRVEPAAGGVDRETLHQPRPLAARFDPGRYIGLMKAVDRFQPARGSALLHLRHLVDLGTRGRGVSDYGRTIVCRCTPWKRLGRSNASGGRREKEGR